MRKKTARKARGEGKGPEESEDEEGEMGRGNGRLGKGEKGQGKHDLVPFSCNGLIFSKRDRIQKIAIFQRRNENILFRY